MTRIYAREVVAYAARFGYLSQAETDDGTPCLVRFQLGCFDPWLARGPAGVKVVVNHGKQLNGNAPSLVLGEPIGAFTGFTTDAVGLRTVATYDATPLATETLTAIRDGVLTAYSLHALIADSKPTGQAREGLPIYDVTDAEVTEAGPTPDPADENARILSIGGTELRAEPDPALEPDAVLAYMSSVTGLDTGRALERIAQSKRHAKLRAREQVRDAESLALVVKRARRRKLVHRAEWQATGYAEAQDIARAAARVEQDALDDLQELLCNDTRLVNMVLRSAGVEP